LALTGEALGLEGVTLERCFQEPVAVSGWNAKHGLPTATQWALAAGSCYLFSVNEGADLPGLERRLRELENDGYGLRRNEGYGRIVVNDPFHWR
jgi:CRISPR-associated protein Csx10